VYPASTLSAVVRQDVVSCVRSLNQIACTEKWPMIPFDMYTPFEDSWSRPRRTLESLLRYVIPSLIRNVVEMVSVLLILYAKWLT